MAGVHPTPDIGSNFRNGGSVVEGDAAWRSIFGTRIDLSGRVVRSPMAGSEERDFRNSLRREESIKIRPEWADRGDRLALKDSWSKGGRTRELPIRNEEQRQVLDEAKRFDGRSSLIPADKRYVEQFRRIEHQCAEAGIHRIHGHRHPYAQMRYRELTGWTAPTAGGPGSKELTAM